MSPKSKDGEIKDSKIHSKQENTALKQETKPFASSFIGTSPKIREVVKLIQKISASSLSVLITGESGTGKELAARTIHENSQRAEKPFIAINCAALPETLLESELFGIEKGVATGVEKRAGKIETASGGTLFLDEIGDMSLPAQAKLLRVLQERKMERVGGRTSIDVDVRLVAATNKDLQIEIEKGSFRKDLYYRLNAVHISMPSLSQMKEDIPVLADHFLSGFASETGKSLIRFSAGAINALMNCTWPGNVRELVNEIKRAAVMAEGNVIEVSDLSENVRSASETPSSRPTPDSETEPQLDSDASQITSQFLRGTVEEIEIQKIKEALSKSGGNKQKAANILGITRQGLSYKIKRYDISSYTKPDSVEHTKPVSTIKVDEPQSHIPKHLADKILGSKISGERKQVTVLFAGLSDFDELSEKLDPEELRTLVNKCFKIILEEVHRYEGTVNQFTGSGAMALFGAPVALEDHPYKAVNAALGIERRIKAYADDVEREGKLHIGMKISLNTGLVVVGSIGNDLRMDYTAIGDTVSLASGLESSTDAGKILITENTHKLVSGYFLTSPAGEIQTKGREPLRTFEVLKTRGTRTRIDVRAEQGLTPFTGREKEMGILQDCFREAKEGRGQIAFIVGEPGVGKSRLLLEFRKSLSGENVNWLDGRCISFGRTMSYLPLIEILKRDFRIDKSDSEEESIRKIEEGILPLGSSLQSALPYLKYLLSVDPGDAVIASMDAQQKRTQTFEALRKVILHESKLSPLVLVIEDLHWIDKTSEEFLVFLAESLAAMPVLLLFTYRPGYSQPLGDKTYLTRISVRSLSREESIKMAESLLHTSGLPDEIKDLINKKAEGNPFFIEELIKSFIEGGIIIRNDAGYVANKNASQIEVPSTIQDIVMARIDRLEESQKKTLQIGSVIGREFSFTLLDKVLADSEIRVHLLALRNSELIYERGLFIDANYVFKHALTHEVAYGSLLIQKRKELHETVGSAIEELYTDKLEEFYEVLAHHFSRTDNLEKAFYYLTLAGRKAKEVFANEEAIVHFEEALKRLDKMAQNRTNIGRRIDILFELENIYDASGKRHEQKKALDGIISLSKSADDDARLSDGYIKQAEYLSVLENYKEAGKMGGAALNLKKKIGDKAGEGRALRGMGFMHWRSGNYNEALKYHSRALSVYRELGGGEAEGFELISLGEIYRKLGRYEDSLSCLHEALQIYQESGIVSGQHICMFNIGNVYRDIGDYEVCLEYYLECWKIRKNMGLTSLNFSGMLLVPTSIASVYWRLGRYSESLTYYREILEINRGLGDRVEEASTLAYIGTIHSIIGDYAASIDHYQKALKIYKELGDKLSQERVLTLIGNVYRQNLNDYLSALPYYQENLEIKRELSSEDEIRSALNNIAVIYWNLALYDEALSYYKEALDICTSIGNIVGEGITLSGMGVVYFSLKKYEEALECNTRALSLLQPAGDRKAEGYVLNSTGNVYYEMGDYQEAWRYYQESLRARKEVGDKKGEAWVLYNLGKTYRRLANYNEARKHYEEALPLAEELKEIELTTHIKHALSDISGTT